MAMRFACESCGSRYRLADEKVLGLLVEVRCRSCAAIVTLRDGVADSAGTSALRSAGLLPAGLDAGVPTASAASSGPALSASTTLAAAAPFEVPDEISAPESAGASAAPSVDSTPPPPPHERLWFALVAGRQEGPLSDEALEREIAGGRVRATTFVWHEGMADWKRLADVPR